MRSIVAAGLGIPRLRLSSAEWGAQWGRRGSGQRAVANADQDVVCLAAEAGLAALAGADRRPQAMWFASTSAPYAEKQAAAAVATLLDLDRDVHTADVAHSLRAGTSALRAALTSGTGTTLVAAADRRAAAPGTEEEILFGDAGVALVVGDGEGLASLVATYSVSVHGYDSWRREGAPYVETDPDTRFAVQAGFVQPVEAAIDGVLRTAGVTLEQVRWLVLPSAHRRSVLSMARRMDRRPGEGVAWFHVDTLGFLGVADPLVGLCGALEFSRPGDLVLVVGSGDGADALLLRVHEPAEGLWSRAAGRSKEVTYAQFLRLTGTLPAPLPQPFGSPTVLQREERLVRWRGLRCKGCGLVHLPEAPACPRCRSTAWSEVPLAKAGTVYTYNAEFAYPNPFPPTPMIVVDLDEPGGRAVLQGTDWEMGDLSVGRRVKIVPRVLHEAGGIRHYFWKAAPIEG